MYGHLTYEMMEGFMHLTTSDPTSIRVVSFEIISFYLFYLIGGIASPGMCHNYERGVEKWI